MKNNHVSIISRVVSLFTEHGPYPEHLYQFNLKDSDEWKYVVFHDSNSKEKVSNKQSSVLQKWETSQVMDYCYAFSTT